MGHFDAWSAPLIGYRFAGQKCFVSDGTLARIDELNSVQCTGSVQLDVWAELMAMFSGPCFGSYLYTVYYPNALYTT